MSLTIPEFAELQTSKASLHVCEHSLLLFQWTSLMVSQVFDYLITIEDEARWVWGRRWDTTRFIFTVSRYLPFLGTGLTSYYLSINSASEPCPASLQITENVIHIIGVVAAELLLILRTYALWLGDKRLLYGLLAYATVSICVAVVIDTSPTQFLPGVVFALIAYKSFGVSRGTRSSILTPEKAITLANVIISFGLPASCVFKPPIQKIDALPSYSIATSWISFLHQESCSICAKAFIIPSWMNESALARERNGLETQHIVGFGRAT
ncbi:hypothetical protein BU15DRAFT_63287 [Melanogaster broomeanus]|nr:hypothetical protein BU15DRAFT_63287 [Melanogaster broomeanus]